MSGHIALFVLAKLDKNRVSTVGIYKLGDSEVYYPGIQSSEAPIEHLLKSSAGSESPITKLVYLCSEECREPSIPIEVAKEKIPSFKTCDEEISTETFFLERIKKYCTEYKIEMPETRSLEYDITRPKDSLPGLVKELHGIDRMSIDFTGGPRDAVILMVFAAQIVKTGAGNTTLGDILYSNYMKKNIIEQNDTFDLIELTNAINAFTDYGRADQLKKFFEGRTDRNGTKELCKSFEKFSDALALCQIGDIEEKVREIHDNLGKAERVLGNGDATLSRAELLFLALIPYFREKFVKENSSRALVVEIIEWCIDHQMIQQALGIFRERIPEYVVNELKCIEPLKNSDENIGKEKADAWLKSLCNASCEEAKNYIHIEKLDGAAKRCFEDRDVAPVSREGLTRLRDALLRRNPLEYANNEHLNAENNKHLNAEDNEHLKDENNKHLSVILVWFRHIWLIRNFIMHVSEPDEKFKDFIGYYVETYGDKKYQTGEGQDQDALSSITGDIKQALESLNKENAIELYQEENWEELIDKIVADTKTISIELLKKVKNNIDSKNSNCPYIFEENLEGITNDDLGHSKISKSDIIRALCTNYQESYKAEKYIRFKDRESNKENLNSAKRSEGDDAYDDLIKLLDGCRNEKNRDYIAWSALGEYSSTQPTALNKERLGVRKLSDSFEELARKRPSEFECGLCILKIGDNKLASQKTNNKNNQNNNGKNNQNSNNKSNNKSNRKNKGSNKKRHTNSPNRKPNGFKAEDLIRMDSETREKLNAFGSQGQ